MQSQFRSMTAQKSQSGSHEQIHCPIGRLLRYRVTRSPREKRVSQCSKRAKVAISGLEKASRITKQSIELCVSRYTRIVLLAYRRRFRSDRLLSCNLVSKVFIPDYLLFVQPLWGNILGGFCNIFGHIWYWNRGHHTEVGNCYLCCLFIIINHAFSQPKFDTLSLKKYLRVSSSFSCLCI